MSWQPTGSFYRHLLKGKVWTKMKEEAERLGFAKKAPRSWFGWDGGSKKIVDLPLVRKGIFSIRFISFLGRMQYPTI